MLMSSRCEGDLPKLRTDAQASAQSQRHLPEASACSLRITHSVDMQLVLGVIRAVISRFPKSQQRPL